MIVLDGHQVIAGLSPEDCRELVRDAMKALSSGETIQPVRSTIGMDRGLLFVMPGALGRQGFFGAKLLSAFRDPDHEGRSHHRGVVVLFEGETGAPVCIADAEEITLLRTAAASVVATEVLARKDARVLALFGHGAQARAHAVAFARLGRFERILVWGRSFERADVFAKDIAAAIGLDVEAIADAEEAARRSDVICTVTSSATPVLLGAWVRPGTHVNAVGSGIAGPVEIDRELLVKSRYVVDSRPSALAQASEFLEAKSAGGIGDDHIVAEIGDVLNGSNPGRLTDDEITIYKSMGHVVQDLAAAAHLYKGSRTSEGARAIESS